MRTRVTGLAIDGGAGFTGAYVGNRLLKKVTMHSIQISVAVLLIVIALALGTGLI